MKVLTKEQIIDYHKELINRYGGSQGIRDEKLFDSALAAPFHSFGGVEFYPSIEEKAARLGYGLAANHPFHDGNKRIGAHAMLAFLCLNDIKLSYMTNELSDIFLSIASGTAEESELLDWINSHNGATINIPKSGRETEEKDSATQKDQAIVPH